MAFMGGAPGTLLRAFRSHSALPNAGGAATGCGGGWASGVLCTGVDCIAGGAAPGLLNCASSAARLAVGVPDCAGGGG
jgi:hypothetical protein